jgi:ribosomal protein L29
MKRNDIKELFTKTDKELSELLKGERDDIAKISMELALQKIKNVTAVGKKKKTIAQILTILRQRELKQHENT